MKSLKRRDGFTLVELLIVIAIIAILVLIVILAIDPQRRIRDANDQAAASNVSLMAAVIEACLTYAGNGADECDNNPDPPGELSQNVNGGPWIRSLPAPVTITPASGLELPITICSSAGHSHRAVYRTSPDPDAGMVQHDTTGDTCPP